MRTPLGGLILLTVAGFLVRLIGLTRESLWNDELFTAALARTPDLNAFFGRLGQDVHPPLYFLLVRAWAQVFGDSEFSLRFTSVLFSTAAIPAVYWLGRRMFGIREALVVAALTAFSFQPIYYAQELRAYALMTLLGALMTGFGYGILRALKDGDSPKRADWIGLALVALASAYTHYFGLLYGALMVVAVGVYAFIRGKGRMEALGVAAFCAVGYLPWLPSLIKTSGKQTTWIQKPTPGTILEIAPVYFSYVVSTLLIVALVFGAALYVRFRQSKPGEKRVYQRELFLAAVILIPFAIVVGKSMVSLPVYTPRNMLIALPAAYILFARAILTLPWRSSSGLIAGLAVFFVSSHMAQIQRQGYFVQPTKAQVREAADVVSGKDSSLPVFACAWDYENFEYYMRYWGSAGRLREFPEKAQKDADVAAAFGNEPEFWLAISNVEYRPEFQKAVEMTYEVVKDKRFLMARAIHLRRKPQP